MASREDLAEEVVLNEYPGIPRITVRPEGVRAPPIVDDPYQSAPLPAGPGSMEGGPQPPWGEPAQAAAGGWGSPEASTGRPSMRLFEPDMSPAPVKPQWQPGMLSLVPLARGLGNVVQGARDSFNAPAPPPPQPRAPVDPTAGPRQMFQQGYQGQPPSQPGLVGGLLGEALQAPQNMFSDINVERHPASTPEQVGQARQQLVRSAAETAMNVAGPGLVNAAVRPGVSAGVFGGRIEPGRKAFAERLEAQGKTPDQIWKEAGLVRFADKQWRQEIPDLAASYRGDADSIASRIFDQKYPEQAGKYRRDQADIRSQDAKQAALLKIQQGKLVLSDVIPHHPELYALYPELRNMPVSHDAHMQASGGYLARHKDTPEGQIVYREEPNKHGKVTPRGLTFKTLIHEIGHAIDNIEGFAKGGNNLASNVDIAGSPARQLFEKQMAQLQKGTVTDQEVRQMRERAGQAAYNALAGEKSSLAAEMRTDFTLEQLAAINPTSMMRPRLDKQFVEYNAPFDNSKTIGVVPQAQMINPAKRLADSFVPPPGVTMRLSDMAGLNNVLALQHIERNVDAAPGIGAAAIRALGVEADKSGTYIRLAIEKDNKGLIPYYRQFGFKRLAERDGDYLMQRDPVKQTQIGDVLNPTPREMQMSAPSPLLRPPGRTMKEENWLPVKPTVLNPRRVFSPGVYENPRIVAEKAAQNVAAEHPALKELFGVTRADLYDISQQGRRKGNMEPEIFAPKKPGESYVAEGLATPQNEQRILDTLGEGLKHRGLREGMVPWYVMDPMFQHMVKLVGKEQAIKDYQRFNATTAPFSASSDVMTEINRGTAANMYAKRGDYDTFHRFAGADRKKLPPGFPADMSDVGGHAYHAIQSDPVVRWLQTGKHGYGQQIVKIPTYHAASGVPETGFQTRWPVPDAHFARGVGAADVRDTKKPGVSMKGAEYRSMAPWYRERIADPLGIEAVPAQALQWGTMSRATGVDTPIGAGKLELLSQRIWERAQKLGIDPKAFRDAVLRGDQHAVGLLTAGAGGAAGLGSVVDPSKYQPGGT